MEHEAKYYLWCQLQLEIGNKHGDGRRHIHARQLLTQAVAQPLAKGIESPHLHRSNQLRNSSAPASALGIDSGVQMLDSFSIQLAKV